MEDLDGLVSQYNTVLTDLMDKYAPAKQKTMMLRATDEIDVAIAARRKAEGYGGLLTSLSIIRLTKKNAQQPATSSDKPNVTSTVEKFRMLGLTKRLCSQYLKPL